MQHFAMEQYAEAVKLFLAAGVTALLDGRERRRRIELQRMNRELEEILRS